MNTGPSTTDTHFRALLERLHDPVVWGAQPEDSVDVIETHISVVLLVGTRAFKIKKPVRHWGIVDYSTPEARLHYCHEEVRLNRRLAPEIYLGVVALVPLDDAKPGMLGPVDVEPDDPPPGDAVVFAVHMVRYAPNATLRALVRDELITFMSIARLAERIAAFHRDGRLTPQQARLALPSALAGVLRRNFRGTAAYMPERFPRSVHEGLRRRLWRRLWQSRHAIRRRIAEGRMVNGHGDMRLEHVVRYKGRSVVVDCVEFSPMLRHIDPLSDVAFLSMDLVHYGRSDLADLLEHHYLEETADVDAAQLLPLYRAYRSHVRACVHVARAGQLPIGHPAHHAAVREAQTHIALAWSFARGGATPPLILLFGLSGSGKSVVARALGPSLRAVLLQSDVIRKELVGLQATDRVEGEEKSALYSDEMSKRTYEEMHAQARLALQEGSAVILDATYLRRASRSDARAIAEVEGAPFAIVHVTCPPEVAHARLRERAARDDDPSDAGVEVYEAQRGSMETLSSREREFAIEVTSESEPRDAFMPLLALFETQLDDRRELLGRDGPRQPEVDAR